MSIHATKELQAYWKENLFYIAVLLSIWFIVSYVCGILIVNQLDAYTMTSNTSDIRADAHKYCHSQIDEVTKP